MLQRIASAPTAAAVASGTAPLDAARTPSPKPLSAMKAINAMRNCCPALSRVGENRRRDRSVTSFVSIMNQPERGEIPPIPNDQYLESQSATADDCPLVVKASIRVDPNSAEASHSMADSTCPIVSEFAARMTGSDATPTGQ